MKKIALTLVSILAICNLSAQIECATIAQIKQQPDKTKIIYTGTATTTYYNGTYNGLFIQDETGGILLKGYTQNGKSTDWVTDSMQVTNITATWTIGSSGSAPGISVATADKKLPTCTPNIAFQPQRITMQQLFADLPAYDSKAIIITDATITPKTNNKHYLTNGVDSIPFYSSNVSSTSPARGEMAGAYIAYQYNRFLLCNAELTKPIAFHSFTDMSAYYKGKNYPILDAQVGGAALVNHVTKIDNNKTAIFAQYLGLTGLLSNGITIIVDGETNIAPGDSIDAFYGKYTDAYKNTANKAEFKGAYFTQMSTASLNIRNSNNPLVVTPAVNISDLLTNQLALNYASQIIASRYAGKLYQHSGNFYYKIAYQISNPDEEIDTMITQTDSILVVAENQLDLNQYVGNNVILSGVYDASVIYQQPTIIIRNHDDILTLHQTFNSIADLIAQGEPLSADITYQLKNPVIVNYKRTQVNSGVSQTWIFIEDETAALALDLGETKTDIAVGDSITNISGTFDDGIRYGTRVEHAPSLSLNVQPQILNRKNQLNYLKASLTQILQDTLAYCSHIVEIDNLGGAIEQIQDLTGTRDDYYLYDMQNPEAQMHYTPATHTGNPIVGENLTLRGLVNFNCLDGYYVIYRISVSDPTVGTQTPELDNTTIYASNNTLHILTSANCSLQVYTLGGLCIYQTSSSSNHTQINNLNSGTYIIKVNNQVYKTTI
jgi:hypothetical protein